MGFRTWWAEKGRAFWDRPGSTVISLAEACFNAGYEERGDELRGVCHFKRAEPLPQLTSSAVEALKKIRALKAARKFFPFDEVSKIIEGAIGDQEQEVDRRHFAFSNAWEPVFWNLHNQALAYGKTPDDLANTDLCKERLERLKACAFQYREAYDKFHAPEDHVVFRSANGVEVWGYEKEGKLTITRTRIVR